MECEGCFILYKEAIEGREDIITKGVLKDTQFFSLSVVETKISPDYMIPKISNTFKSKQIIFGRLYLLKVMRYYKEKNKIK